MASESPEEDVLKNTWEEYEDYLDQTGYESNMMYIKPEDEETSDLDTEMTTLELTNQEEAMLTSLFSPPPEGWNQNIFDSFMPMNGNDNENRMTNPHATCDIQLDVPSTSEFQNQLIGKDVKGQLDSKEAPTNPIKPKRTFFPSKQATKESQGGPAKTYEVATLTSLMPNEILLADNTMLEDSRTVDGLRSMIGALVSVPSNGYIVVGMVVPQHTPILELHGYHVKDGAARDKVLSMSPYELARVISNGELWETGITSIRYRIKPAEEVKGLALFPRVKDHRSMLTAYPEKDATVPIYSKPCKKCKQNEEKRKAQEKGKSKNTFGPCTSTLRVNPPVASQMEITEKVADYLNAMEMCEEQDPLMLRQNDEKKKTSKSARKKARRGNTRRAATWAFA